MLNVKSCELKSEEIYRIREIQFQIQHFLDNGKLLFYYLSMINKGFFHSVIKIKQRNEEHFTNKNIIKLTEGFYYNNK